MREPDPSPGNVLIHGALPSPPIAMQTVFAGEFQEMVTGASTAAICTLAVRVVGTLIVICANVAAYSALAPLPHVSENTYVPETDGVGDAVPDGSTGTPTLFDSDPSI
jgi:hypothetical protein